MKHSIIILTFFALTSVVSGQKRKLPPEGTLYSISKLRFDYPPQTGKLEIIRADTLGHIILQTNTSAMRIGKGTASDSTIIALFQAGIITSDILIKAINEESRCIDYKGDTIDFTLHIDTKNVQLVAIQQKDLPTYIRKNKSATYFQIAVVFNQLKSGEFTPAIYDFDLYLESTIEAGSLNFSTYLKGLKRKYLQYVGIEI